MNWLDADPGPIAIVIAGALLTYYVAVEPWWGKRVFTRLALRRPHDPGALIAMSRLTVGVQCAATAAVALAVVLDPGVGAGSIGLTWPVLPGGDLSSVVVGGAIGLVIVAVAAAVIGIRAVRSGKGLTVAPAAISPMIPVTTTERWWSAAVAVGAGISEELVFRGLLLAVAVGLGLNAVVAAAVLTLVFGAAHLYQGVGGLVTATLFGAVMAAIALGTRSLLLPIVLHAVIDLRGLLLTRPAETPAWRRPATEA